MKSIKLSVKNGMTKAQGKNGVLNLAIDYTGLVRLREVSISRQVIQWIYPTNPDKHS